MSESQSPPTLQRQAAARLTPEALAIYRREIEGPRPGTGYLFIANAHLRPHPDSITMTASLNNSIYARSLVLQEDGPLLSAEVAQRLAFLTAVRREVRGPIPVYEHQPQPRELWESTIGCQQQPQSYYYPPQQSSLQDYYPDNFDDEEKERVFPEHD